MIDNSPDTFIPRGESVEQFGSESCRDMSSCCDTCLFPDKAPNQIDLDRSNIINIEYERLSFDKFPDSIELTDLYLEKINSNYTNIFPDYHIPFISTKIQDDQLSLLDYSETMNDYSPVRENFTLSNKDVEVYTKPEHNFLYKSISNINSLFPDNYFENYPELPRGQHFTQLSGLLYPTVYPLDNNWYDIKKIESDYFYNTGAFYGRAIAQITPTFCSGWLLGGSFVATAAHCRTPRPGINFNSYPGSNCPSISERMSSRNIDFSRRPISNIGVRFDQYGKDNIVPSQNDSKILQNFFAGGLKLSSRTIDTINQLIDLGLPSQEVFRLVRGLGENIFSWRSCSIDSTSFTKQEQCRDIDYYTCPRKNISYELGAELHNIKINPSDVFGSIPLFDRSLNPGKSIYLLSRNCPIGVGSGSSFTCNTPRTTLLSPGGLIDDITLVNNNEKLKIHVDNIKSHVGSSGGVGMDFRTNSAIGVDSFRDPWGLNLFVLPDRAYRILEQETEPRLDWRGYPMMSKKLIPGRIKSQYIGGKGGTKKSLYCPSGFAVAGLVGSTIHGPQYRESTVGNLGLICLPYSNFYNFSMAKVFAGGSIDTHLNPVLGEKFNYYINEKLSSGAPFHLFGDVKIRHNYEKFAIPKEKQSFVMCPPGYFIDGIWAFPGKNFGGGIDVVRRIYKIRCIRWDGKMQFMRTPRENIGGKGNLASPIFCPTNSVTTGININSGWYTDGFEMLCQRPR